MSKKHNTKISDAIVYQEFYQEMRRYRDYELTSSNWYTTLLLAILSSIIVIRFTSDAFLQHLFDDILVRSVICVITLILYIGGVFSVNYVSTRYQKIRNYVNDNLEPEWKKTGFKNVIKPQRITPRFFIYLTLTTLFLAVVLILFFPQS